MIRTWLCGCLVVATTACGATGSSPAPPFGAPSPTPTPSPVRVRFTVVGDFGTGDEWEGTVASRIRRWSKAHDSDAFVTTGDNVYPSGHPSRFDAAWREPYGWVKRRDIPILATLGNHDVETRNGKPVMLLLDMPGRYYATKLGSARLIVLDANDPYDARQRNWLERKLSKEDQTWKIVVFHTSAFSCGMHGGDARIQQEWVPLFEKFDVDLVLTGHNHVYERFRPRSGVTYVVTGGGGSGLYAFEPCAEGTPKRAKKNNTMRHFMSVTVGTDRLKLKAIGYDGAIFDRHGLDP